MADEYPPLRQVRARLLTQAGWMFGTFHVPEEQSFLEFLNDAGPFFKVTDVTVVGDPLPTGFCAVRRGEVTLVLPEVEEEELLLGKEGSEPHTVSCWLPGGMILGTLRLPPGVRVSDYLMNHPGFAVLRRASGRSEHGPVNEAPVVFVHAGRVIGVVEREE